MPGLASAIAALVACVCGWLAVAMVLRYGPGMSKDKLVVALAVVVGAVVPDVPALVELLGLHPVVSRALCSALLALAAAYGLGPRKEAVSK